MLLKENIIEILKNGTIDNNIFRLPILNDRKDYIEVNKVLEGINGKWNRKLKGHVFDGMTEEDIEEKLFNILSSGEVITENDIKKEFQYYSTPNELANYLIELADIQEGDDILEPSAGTGSILDLINEKYTDNKGRIYGELIGCELNINFAKQLQDKGYLIVDGDFLRYNPQFLFDKIIANPPFNKSQDAKHILHMYKLLKKGGKIVSVAASSIKTKNTKPYKELRELNPVFIDIPKGTFKESGTMVSTCIVILTK